MFYKATLVVQVLHFHLNMGHFTGLLQDYQLVVLGAQLVSVVLGGLQLGVQLSFDLKRDAVTLPVQ